MNAVIVALNLGYAVGGALLSIAFMLAAYKVLDRLTPFSTGEELRCRNQAVGMVVAGMFVAIGVSVGLVVGLGLN